YLILLFSCFTLNNVLANPFDTKAPKFLPVEQAFKATEILFIDEKTVKVKFFIAENHYLYKSKFKIQSSPSINSTLTLPEGQLKEDEYFGKQEVYYHSVSLMVNFEQKAKNSNIQLTFQGCSEEGLCYPPTNIDINKVDEDNHLAISETQSLANQLNSDRFFWGLLTFFVSGILLSLTPCVLPMVPVLSGIILGANPTRGKLLTLSYIAGVVTMYTLLGIFAGLTGNLLSSSLQNTFFIGVSSVLFFLFALAMFDFYQLGLPQPITEKINHLINKLKTQHVGSTFVLGFLSALILSPCVAPPLAASILYISQTENYIFGGMALFSLSLGMSLPLFIVGFSLGQFLPKPGAWMNYIKKLMGFALLAMAIYIARPLMSDFLFYLLLLLNLFIALIFSFYQKDLIQSISKKSIIFLVAILAIMSGYLIHSAWHQYSNASTYDRHVFFNQVDTVAELETVLNTVKEKPTLIDFYADWCVACLEYEKYTFQDAKVSALMQDFYRIQIDVTENNLEHKNLLNQFNLFGPPAIIFFNKQGKHLKQYDIVGYKNADEFLTLLTKIKQDDQ
ncbi:MAG: protein-disulfide reductase DsbD, partial [Proteobacteria bacterium]|nr:protein-disulfide reductase DsbD [Pseudomonadota bacterium]